MPATPIDGKALAQEIRADVARRVELLRARGATPRLDAVLVSESPDSPAHVYAENQRKTCRSLGIDYHLHILTHDADFDDIAGRVLLLNTHEDVRAIMLHLPLPDGVDTYKVQSLIAPKKDAEGVNPANIGNIVYGRSSLAPCTAMAVMKMIESTGMDLRGKTAVVVGASDVVGKPIAVMLMRPEATVVSCNKHTQGIQDLARQADVLIAAAGVPELVTANWVKPGAVVIDVGIHRLTDDAGNRRTIGDVHHESVAEVAGRLSPVPGGVGPVTVATLLENVVAAAESGR